MAVITREDGVQLTYLNYRETIEPTSTGDLRVKVRSIADLHGKNCCLVPIGEKVYEGVFTNDDGYPLGECIWYHFDKPKNMILCEYIQHTAGDYALVAIRDGIVYLGEILDRAAVIDELTSLLGTQVQYEIYTFGDVPLVEEAAGEGTFAFPAEYVQSFSILPQTQIANLVPPPELKLCTPDEALAAAGIKQLNPMVLVGVAAFVAVIIGVYFLFFSAEPPPPPVVVKKVVQVDPYLNYIRTLMTPAPLVQAQAVLENMNDAFSVPGWAPTKLNYSGNSIIIQFQQLRTPIKPSTQSIINYAKLKGANYKLESDNAAIMFSVRLKNRKEPKTIQVREYMLYHIIDTLNSMGLPGKSEYEEPKQSGKYATSTVNFSLSNITGNELLMFADAINDLPVNLKSIEMGIQPSGIFSAKVVFDVVGS